MFQDGEFEHRNSVVQNHCSSSNRSGSRYFRRRPITNERLPAGQGPLRQTAIVSPWRLCALFVSELRGAFKKPESNTILQQPGSFPRYQVFLRCISKTRSRLPASTHSPDKMPTMWLSDSQSMSPLNGPLSDSSHTAPEVLSKGKSQTLKQQRLTCLSSRNRSCLLLRRYVNLSPHETSVFQRTPAEHPLDTTSSPI